MAGSAAFDSPVALTRVYDAQSGQLAGEYFQADGHILHAALCATQPWAALAVTKVEKAAGRRQVMFVAPPGVQQLEVWNWQTQQRLYDPISLPAEARAVTFHPEGRCLAVLTAAGEIQTFDPATGKLLHAWKYPVTIARQPDNLRNSGSLCFSPDGQMLFSWGLDNTLRAWDWHSGMARFTLEQGEGMFLGLAISPDQRRLATCHDRQDVTFWNLVTGQMDADVQRVPQSEQTWSVEFSPDGSQLLLGGRNGRARLWNWQTGQALGQPMMHSSAVVNAHFVPNSPWIVTASADGLPRLWDGRTGLPLSPAFAASTMRCQNCLLLRGGKIAVAACADGSIHGFDIEEMLTPSSLPTADDAERDQLGRWAQLLSGYEMVNESTMQYLPSEKWQQLWKRYRNEK
jgi:WD40 repeat protein